MLAQVDGEVKLDVEGQVTQRSVLDALEARYPMLRGTIRDHVTHKRRAVRAILRLRARICPMNRRTRRCPRPSRPAHEPFLVVGAIAGG